MKKDSFLYQALCEEKNGKLVPSSKRLAGIICIVVPQLCIIAATVLELVIVHALSGVVSSLLITDLSIGAGLIGLKTLSTMVGGNKVSMGNNQPQHEETNNEEQSEEQ